MDFKEDKQTWNNNREFLFGHNVLVCPVVDPQYTTEKIVRTDPMSGWDRKDLKEGEYAKVDWTQTKSYKVYLPAGAQWYDYWTNKKLDGGQTLNVTTTLAHSPLYIKAGSIMPMSPEVQYANENKFDKLDIVVYPGANAKFTLYEDEGDNYATSYMTT